MIKRVVLENWRTHARSEFEFEKGTNVLVGQMGSGKSSVMDAVCFALFGTFPALLNKRVSLDEIITNKPNKEAFAKIFLEFEYNGKKFEVERIIKRKGTNEAKVSCNGRFLAGPKTTDATNAVEHALEINYNLFSRAVYSEQNQIDFFLKLSPSQRKAQFDELLDLQKYENARANAVSLGNKIKDLAVERKNWVEKQRGLFDEKEIDELKQKIKAKLSAQKEIEEKICEIAKKIEALGKEESLLEKQAKKFRALKEKELCLQAEEKELEKSILETKKALKGKNRQEIEKELASKEKEIEKILEEEKKCEEETGKFRLEADAFIREQGLFEEKILQIEKSLRELRHAKANCPVCRRTLGEETKNSLMLESTVEKKEIEAKQKQLLEKMKKTKESIEKEKEKKILLAEKKDSEKESLSELKSLAKEIDLIEKKEKKLVETKKELSLTGKELEKTGFDENELKKKQKEFIEKKALAGSLEKEKHGNSEMIAQLEESLRKSEEAKKQVLELEKSIDGLEKVCEKTIIFTNALKATQAELRGILVENINVAMNEIWQKIYPYQDYTSARLEIEEGSYELKVKDRNGNWTRVEGILSGGERSAAALCIRIAFSLVLTQNLSLLILDEPTHNLDAHSVNVLSKIMREHLPELVEQIFIITHDMEMEKAASASIYVLNREKNSDGATIPEKMGIMD